MKRACIALVLLLLVGCGGQGPLAPHAWQGVTQTSTRTDVLRLVYTLYGDTVIGNYTIGSATSPTGKAEGHIAGDTIVLTLSPTTTCSYSFTGTITATRLVGTYVPATCVGGIAGSWDLIRSN